MQGFLLGMRAEELSPVEASKVKANFVSIFSKYSSVSNLFQEMSIQNVIVKTRTKKNNITITI